MTLYIYDKRTGIQYEYHYQDAIIDGNSVYLNRKRHRFQRVWNREDVTIRSSEDDHIYILDQNTGQFRKIS